MVHSSFISQRRRLAPSALPAALVAGLCASTLTALAQPGANAARPDALDPKAHVPALNYESAFAGYRRLDDPRPTSWREANDAVARIGGWRFYAREAQQPDAAPAAKPTEPAAPAGTAKPLPMPPGPAGPKTP